MNQIQGAFSPKLDRNQDAKPLQNIDQEVSFVNELINQIVVQDDTTDPGSNQNLY